MASMLYRLGRWSYRRPWRVTLTWLVLLALAGVGAAALSRPTVDAFSIPGTESQRAVDLLQQRFPDVGADGAVARVVFAAPAGQRLSDPARRAAVEQVVSRLRAAPQVAEVAGPFEAKAVSADGRVGLAQVGYKVAQNDLTDADRQALFAAVQAGRDAGLTVEVGGDAAQAPADEGPGELAGVVVAAVVLIITFGSLLAAGLPLITALMGVVVSLLVVTMTSRFIDLNSDTPGLALMLGLAVSIDYALFIGFRYREELRVGGERDEAGDEAAGRAVGTAGSAVVFAGLTVIIALAGLAVVNIPILTQIGLAAAFTVALAVLIALTLLPALLGFVGRRILGRAGRAEAEAEAAPRGGPNAGRRWGLLVTRLPWLIVGVCAVALAVLAIPALSIRLGLPDDSSAPVDSTQRKAYDLLTEGFGPGFNGPLLVVVDTGAAGSAAPAAQQISAMIARLPNVVSVSSPVYDRARGNTALMSVIPRTAPASAATEHLVDGIRRAAAGLRPQTQAEVSVTGQTAINIDITERTSAAIVPYLAIVVGLAFLLLMVVFRSILVPLIAVAGFLLSLAATFGAMVAVFQWGWLNNQLGLEGTGLIMNLIPIMVIGLVFGLAMDYEVFLVSRVREEFTHGSGAVEAIVQGCGRSARVITGAAIIMIGVFSGFMLANAQLTQSFGFALAVAIFFDALVVRMTIVPAVMALFGRAAWWLPGWLGRVVPRIDIEGERLQGAAVAPQGISFEGGVPEDRAVERPSADPAHHG